MPFSDSSVDYVEEDIKSRTSGLSIHTYRWIPKIFLHSLENSTDNATDKLPKASVFLLHGLHSNTYCEYLEPDPQHNQARRLYEGSIPQLLNQHDFVVFAHDHQGHGKSGGTPKGYFNLMDTLVEDIYQYVMWITGEKYPCLQNKPIFLIGCSMGSLLGILFCLKYGNLIRGAVLISPAVRQPNNQFGYIGRLLRPVSGITAKLLPTLPVLRLPRNERFPELQKCWDNDELNYHGRLRARVGAEFLRAYQEIEEKVETFKTGFIMYYGSEDTLVDPQGMQEFYDRAASTDKNVTVMEGRWHILHHEPGKEKVREEFLNWLEERCKS
eukprot:jgi/Galph1/3175/GphlegSOOS_G1849.1